MNISIFLVCVLLIISSHPDPLKSFSNLIRNRFCLGLVEVQSLNMSVSTKWNIFGTGDWVFAEHAEQGSLLAHSEHTLGGR